MFKNTGNKTPAKWEDQMPGLTSDIELHHYVTDLTVDEFTSLLKLYLKDEILVTGTTSDPNGMTQSINGVAGQFEFKVIPQDNWSNDVPCGAFNLEVTLGNKAGKADLLMLNEYNKNVAGVKVFIDYPNIYTSSFLVVEYGVTGQTVVSQIAYLIESSRRLILSLHKESENTAN